MCGVLGAGVYEFGVLRFLATSGYHRGLEGRGRQRFGGLEVQEFLKLRQRSFAASEGPKEKSAKP